MERGGARERGRRRGKGGKGLQGNSLIFPWHGECFIANCFVVNGQVSIESDKSCDVWVAFPGTPQASLKNVVLAHPDPRIG